MQFIHYKEFPPINLAKVGTIGKENQQVAQDTLIYAVAFYEFERKVGYWIFQSEEERDQVYDQIRGQFSRDVGAKNSAQVKPAVLRG